MTYNISKWHLQNIINSLTFIGVFRPYSNARMYGKIIIKMFDVIRWVK
jgi:hypothetical protein